MPSASSFAEVLSTAEPSAGAELLLNLIAEASSGRDISSAVPSIVEAVFGRSSAHPVVKKLAYDLCKAAAFISDADCDFLAIALKADVGSSHPDLALAALRFVPFLPRHYLGVMQTAGELEPLLLPTLQHKDGTVRAAAVSCLHQVQLCPAVLGAAAAAAGPAYSYQERWVRLADKVLDEEPLVVGAAMAALCEMLETAGLATSKAASGLGAAGVGGAACTTPGQFLLRRVAGDIVVRLAAALGPVLETCAFAPAPNQVSIARLLLLLAHQLFHLHRSQGSSAPTAPSQLSPDPGTGLSFLSPGDGPSGANSSPSAAVPTLGGVLPSLCGYLHQRVGVLDVAVRLECCRSLLGILSLIHDIRSTGDLELAGAALVPESWSMSAVSALLELQHRQLVEPGLPDAVMAIAHNLPALPLTVRQNAVQQLLPLVSQLSDVPCRMEAYALVWQEVLKDEMRARLCGGKDAAGAALSLGSLLSDPYVSSLIKGTLGGGAFGSRASGDKALRQASDVAVQQAGGSVISGAGPRPIAEGREQADDTSNFWADGSDHSDLEAISMGPGAWGVPRRATRRGARPVAEGKEDKASSSSGTSFLRGLGFGGKKEGKKDGDDGLTGKVHAMGQQAKEAASSAMDKTTAAGRAALDHTKAATDRTAAAGRGAMNRTAVAGREAMDKTAAMGKAAADRTSAAGKVAADGATVAGQGTAAAGRSAAEAGRTAAERAVAAGKSSAEGAAAAGQLAADRAADKAGGVFNLLNLNESSDPFDPAVAAAAAAAEGQRRRDTSDLTFGGTAKAAVNAVASAAADGVRGTGAPLPTQLLNLVAGVPSEIPKRLQGLNTHRHELLVALLDATHRHAQECEVLEMCLAAQDAERRDMPPSAAAAAMAGTPARDVRVVHWVQVARTVLVATQTCITWEPLVTPAITTQLSSEADGHAAADFSSVPPDCWLQLMQAACHAARAVAPILRSRAVAAGAAPAPAAPGPAPAPAPATGGSEAAALTAGLAAAPSAPGALPLPPVPGAPQATGPGAVLSALASTLEQEGRELQVLLRQVLRCWSSLSRTVRVRVVWVASHYCALPPAVDEGWELLLKALADTMSRSGSGLRLNELMASASLGILFRSERQSWPRDKPFIFDVVAASALCERPDLELCSLFVTLACLQHLTTLLHNQLAAAAAATVAGETTAPGEGGPPDAKHVQVDVVLVAARLEALARDVQTSEVTALPHLKEWVGRIMRMCGALAAYQPPEGPPRRRRDSSSSGGSSSDSDAPPRTTGARGSPGPGRLPNPLATAASESVESVDSGPTFQLPVMMPPSMYGRPPPMRVDAPVPARTSGMQFPQQGGSPTLDKPSMAASIRRGMSMSRTVAPGASAVTVPTTVMTVVPAPPYLAHSCTGDCLWGYPFAGPRTSVLFHSKHSRRHRALIDHLAAARATLQSAARLRAARRAGAGLTGGGATGLHLLASAGHRLDSPEFWQVLPGAPQHWQELSGSADPLLIRGCVRAPDRANDTAAAAGSGAAAMAGGGNSGAGACDSGVDESGLVSEDSLVVVLEVTNRMSVELGGVELLLRTSGPALVERRGMSWDLPRLAAGEKVTKAVQMRLLGHTPCEVQCSVQLAAAVLPGDSTPVNLFCQPLRVPMLSMLRPAIPPPPLGPPAATAEFFRTWSALPARATLSGVCAWPGVEGQVLALSAMLRQPLAPVLLQHLPASGAHQSAFQATTLSGQAMLLLVFMQLQPAALGSAATGTSQSTCQVCVRSSCPELVNAVQLHAAEFMEDLSSGTVLTGVTAPGPLAVGRAKPPTDPRVSALHHSFLATSTTSSAPGSELNTLANAGPKVSHVWLRSAALAEWQRLVS